MHIFVCGRIYYCELFQQWKHYTYTYIMYVVEFKAKITISNQFNWITECKQKEKRKLFEKNFSKREDFIANNFIQSAI